MKNLQRLWTVMVVMGLLAVVLAMATGGSLPTQAAEQECNLLANGSFEFWSHCAVGVLPEARKWPFEGDDPLFPTRWSWDFAKPNRLARSTDAHGGRYALSVVASASGGSLSLGKLEVVPGAKYSFGAWAKGTGELHAEVIGWAPEGPQRLGLADGKASKEWTKIGGSLQIPGHIRMVSLCLRVDKSADLILDDAYIAAPLDQPYDPDAVLAKKTVKDENTLVLLDFDKDASALRLEKNAKLTGPDGGRFGRGLRLDGGKNRGALASFPFKLPAMPVEGTLECWLSPDDSQTGDKQQYYLQIRSAEQALSLIYCYCNRIALSGLRQDTDIVNWFEMRGMRKGEWHHLAVTWDRTALRTYLDGVLETMSTKPLPAWAGAPVEVWMGSEFPFYGWDGMIDEIRISKIKRYGPFTPKGAKPNPLPVAASPAEEKPKDVAKPKVDFTEARKKLLGSIPPTQPGKFETVPNAEGDYVYEATSARSLVEGIKLELSPDMFVKGLTTATADRTFDWGPRLGGVYWRLKNIQPGRYWIGVLYCASHLTDGVSEANPNANNLHFYLNGREVQGVTFGDPVQVAPGVWFAEMQSAGAEELKEGDEIATLEVEYYNHYQTARLILHAREPRHGPLPLWSNPGPSGWNPGTTLGISVETSFLAAPGKPIANTSSEGWRQQQWMETPDDFLRGSDGGAVARCWLANPLPVPVEVDFECVVKGYYLQEAGRDVARLTLAPHACVPRDVSFKTTPDDPEYSITAKVKAVKKPDLGWPAYDEFAFFPGLRHLTPCPTPDSFEYCDRRQVCFKQPAKDLRQRVALDGQFEKWGQWEMALTHDLNPPMPPPADLKFEPCRVLGDVSREKDPKAHGVYFRRKFVLPEGAASRVARLIVDSVCSEGTAYVNGQKVGNVRGCGAPLVGEATKALRPGQNEVVLVIRDSLAVMNPQYVNPADPVENCRVQDAPTLPQKLGITTCWGGENGVWLELAPEVAAREVKVETSVRTKTIGAGFTAVNGGKSEMRIRARAVVEDARQPVLTVGEQDLTLKPGESKPLEFTKKWAAPRLWNWGEPNLYVLAVELTDASTGQRLDLARARFGFRESWIQDGQIYLNGQPVRLKQTGHLPPFIPGMVDARVGRGATLPDYYDEAGIMATQLITCLVNQPSKYNVESDPFWEAARTNALTTSRRLWNHPCIIAWDLSNEWYCYAGYFGADPDLMKKRFKSVSDAVEKRDSTRWTFFSSDGDIGGWHNTMSTHYMQAHRVEAGGFDFDGHSAYLPDGSFFRTLDRDFRPGEEIAAWPDKYRLGSKPLMDTEDVWGVSGELPPGTSRFVGEDAVLSPSVGSAGPIIWMWKQRFDGQRDLGMAIHNFHEHGAGMLTRGYAIQTFIMPDVVHHGFSGRKMVRLYSLLNDLFHPAKLALKWKMVGPDGKAADGANGTDEQTLGSGQTGRGALTFTLPSVTKLTKFTLQLRLESDGKFVCGEDRDIEVWPDSPIPAGPLARKLTLYDPKGDTAKAFKFANVEFASAAALASPAGDASANALVIGEGALDATTARQAAVLGKFVEDGGRVVILAQTVLPLGLPAATMLENREWSSQPFVRLPIHPVLAGITSWDLHFWAPDRVSARGAYSKPEGGAAVPLVDSGVHCQDQDKGGLEWVQMMEMYRGKGLYLLCQLPLVANRNDEPMARELLSRVLRYTGGKDAFRAPIRRFRLVAAKDSPLERKLRDLRIAYDLAPAEAPLDATVPVLVASGIVPNAVQQTAWKKGLADGATLVITESRPEDSNWLSELAGQPVRITVPRYRSWEGRGCRNGFNPLTAGLSHLDLFWKGYMWNDITIENPEFIIEQLQDASVECAGSRELVYPGALVEIKVGQGQGRLILDQRRWTTNNEKLLRLANRNLCALSLGLNVNVGPIIPLRELPADIECRPIDLTPYANRALADDVAEDGKGGWTDQGPTGDLRTFPTGRQTFQGIPFEVGKGKKSIIVLDTRPDKKDRLLEATIPVGHPVEGFYFLHGAAYAGGQVGLYQVQYADGTTADIPLVAGENIRDWADWAAASGGFPGERWTRTVVAWTGSCPMFPNGIAIYRTLWVNPRPEVSVKAVRFANPAKAAVPALIGLTAVVKKDQKDTNADMAKAQEFFKQAKTALAANKPEEAKTLLKQAVAAWPSLDAAHQALADLCEKGGKEDETLEAYRQWTKAGARTPLPWNRLGEILEKRKDYKGALDAYTQSLKIEWNQPPIGEAKTRMEKQLNQK